MILSLSILKTLKKGILPHLKPAIEIRIRGNNSKTE
jgi:hypothetical protein